MLTRNAVILLILVSLVACNGNNNANQTNVNKPSQRYKIQTQTDEILDHTETDQGMDNNVENQEQEKIDIPEGSPQLPEQPETPQQEQNLKNNEPEKASELDESEGSPDNGNEEVSPNIEDKQAKEGNDPTQKEDAQEEVVDNNVSTLLPFEEFRSRWNAISDTFTGENYVHSLEQVQTETNNYYRTTLNNTTELRVFVNDKNFINNIKLIGTSGSVKENFSMITSWWQLLLLSNPEMTDFDETFSLMGVGPNANLLKVKEQTFSFGDVTYNILLANQNYTFEAVFP